MLDSEDMGRAGIEPDVEDVFDLLEGVRVVSSPRKSDGARVNQASAPSLRKISRMRASTSASFSTSPVFFSTKMASGTPQARWRDSTQSGRDSTIAPMRLAPCGGYQSVWAMALTASWRSVSPPNWASGLSSAANHCGVARKITGALERQLCG